MVQQLSSLYQTTHSAKVSVQIEADVSAVARMVQRKTTGWLISEVGNMLIAGQPQLVIGKEIVWRVPVLLTSSKVGTVGEVGQVMAEYISGEPQINDQLREDILSNVRQLDSTAFSSTG